MVWMNFAHLFLGLHNAYINLSIFSLIFCHISMTACHMMSKMIIWAIGPMAYVPTKFHWDSFKRRWKSDQPLQQTLKYYIYKNNIPSPFWGNGITRGTVPRGTVYPIPNELSLWPRTMFRQVTPSHDHWRHLIYIYPIGGLSVLGKSVPKSHRFDLSRSLQAKGNVTKRKAKPGFL